MVKKKRQAHNRATLGSQPKKAKAKATKTIQDQELDQESLANENGRMWRIPTKDLRIDMSYQREQTPSKVNKLVNEWDWPACGTIAVADRGKGWRDMRDGDLFAGDLFVIDGGHRLTAARKLGIGKLPCIIFKSEGAKQEAAYFVKINSNRKNVSAVAKYRAAIVAEDETALKVQAVLDSLKLSASKSAGNSRMFTCVYWAMKQAKDNFARFENVLRVAQKLSEDVDKSIPASILKGLQYLETNIEDGVRNVTLRKRMQKLGMTDLVDSINSHVSTRKKVGVNPLTAGQGILLLVNDGLDKWEEITILQKEITQTEV